MKRHQTGPPKKRTALPLCMCAVLAVTGLACVPDSGGWLYNTALISAGLLMPEGGSRLLEDRLSTLSSSTAAAPASPSDPGGMTGASSEDASSEPDSSDSSYDLPDAPEVAEENRLPISEQPISKSGAQFGAVYVLNTTGRELNIEEELSVQPDLQLGSLSEPTVLIVHTHTQEAYQPADRDYYDKTAPTRTSDNLCNVVAAGNAMANRLKALGIGVVHDTTVHDTQYSGAYKRSADTIQENLKQYPTIRVVIDLHRDAIGSETKVDPAVEVDGKKAAQVMLIAGCETEGGISHPNWRENLRFALRLQQSLETNYPGITRPIKFMNTVYNENLTNGSLLMEVGTDATSVEQAIYSGELAANSLSEVLKALQE